MNIDEKRTQEKYVMEKMMHLYCKGKHGTPKKQLCEHCAALLQYANDRTQHCPHMENKTFCSKCPTQCYKPEKREEIRQVMRYAGPKMLLHDPVLVIKHALDTRKQKQPHAAKTEIVEEKP